MSLQLTNKVHYFGFAWGAGDDNNRVSFYNGASLLGTFSSLDIQALLTNPTVTAVNGSIYNSPDYLGQPGSGHTINNGENYAFVHFLITAGTDRIDFFNTNTGTGFESDNHTIRTTAPNVAGSSLVFVTNLTVAPEPGTLALLLLGAAGGLVVKRRR